MPITCELLVRFVIKFHAITYLSWFYDLLRGQVRISQRGGGRTSSQTQLNFSVVVVVVVVLQTLATATSRRPPTAPDP